MIVHQNACSSMSKDKLTKTKTVPTPGSYSLRIFVDHPEEGTLANSWAAEGYEDRPDVVGLLFRRAIAETCIKLGFDDEKMAVVARSVVPSQPTAESQSGE